MKLILKYVLRNPNFSVDAEVYNKTEKEKRESFIVEYKVPIDDTRQIKFRFKVRNHSDVGGEDYIRDKYWKNILKDSTVVVYIIDGCSYLDHKNPEYIKRVALDFDWLLSNIQVMAPNFKVIIVINKADHFSDALSYEAFKSEQQELLNSMREDLIRAWPSEYKNSFSSPIFLSLKDGGLRAHTLKELILHFAGAKYLHLLRNKG